MRKIETSMACLQTGTSETTTEQRGKPSSLRSDRKKQASDATNWGATYEKCTAMHAISQIYYLSRPQ